MIIVPTKPCPKCGKQTLIVVDEDELCWHCDSEECDKRGVGQPLKESKMTEENSGQATQVSCPVCDGAGVVPGNRGEPNSKPCSSCEGTGCVLNPKPGACMNNTTEELEVVSLNMGDLKIEFVNRQGEPLKPGDTAHCFLFRVTGAGIDPNRVTAVEIPRLDYDNSDELLVKVTLRPSM